jgi:peptide chain release factor 2
MEDDAEVVAEAEAALAALEKTAAAKELEALLDGEADGNDTFLEVNAGAGGTESCDWAGMLARMYVRWAEKRGYKVELQSERAGEEAGIKSALQDQGPQRLWLAEVGIGRAPAGADLPYDSARAAHLVLLGLGLPGGGRQYRDRGEPRRYPDRHLPLLGRGRAAREHHRLGGADHPHAHRDRGDLVGEIPAPEPRHRHEGAEIAALPAGAGPRNAAIKEAHEAKGEAGWGNQIRSYVLQPYQMVKDLRTNYETSDTRGVLDGDLDG